MRFQAAGSRRAAPRRICDSRSRPASPSRHRPPLSRADLGSIANLGNERLDVLGHKMGLGDRVAVLIAHDDDGAAVLANVGTHERGLERETARGTHRRNLVAATSLTSTPGISTFARVSRATSGLIASISAAD